MPTVEQMKERAKNPDYKVWLYKMVYGQIKGEVFMASEAEKKYDEGWRLSPVDAMGKERTQQEAKNAGVSDAEMVQAIDDHSTNLNRMLNLDAIEDLDTLKDLIESYEDADGKSLADKVNWKVKGRRTIEHVRCDVRDALIEAGIMNADGDFSD